MAVNLYDYANQLEQALRESEEYKAIKEAFANVKANEESKSYSTSSVKLKLTSNKTNARWRNCWRRFTKAQEQAQAIEKDENISALMNAEQKWVKYSKKSTKLSLNH